jgi:hypothetical protein
MSINEYPKEVLGALERDCGIRIRGREQNKRDADGRFCYGANCTWFGSIHEVSSTKIRSGDVGHALPCCPLCGGILYEMQDQSEWWDGIDKFERGEYPAGQASLSNPHPHPGYRAMWEWQRAQKKCFPQAMGGLDRLVAAYKEATGVTVDIER